MTVQVSTCRRCGFQTVAKAGPCPNCGEFAAGALQPVEEPRLAPVIAAPPEAPGPTLLCRKCSTEFSAASKFCPNCGLQVQIAAQEAARVSSTAKAGVSACGRCGSAVDARVRFCSNCGAAVGVMPRAELDSSKQPQPMRVQHTEPTRRPPLPVDRGPDAGGQRPQPQAPALREPVSTPSCPDCGWPAPA